MDADVVVVMARCQTRAHLYMSFTSSASQVTWLCTTAAATQHGMHILTSSPGAQCHPSVAEDDVPCVI